MVIMKQIKFLLLFVVALMLSTAKTFAQTVGTRFEVNNIIYQITVKDLAHHENNTVAIYQINGSGVVNIPEQIENKQDREKYKVTSVIGWVPNQIKSGVTEIKFPNTLVSISEGSFRLCPTPTFTKVTIPASCTDIGEEVFTVNSSFKEFVVDGNNPKYKSVNGVLYTKDGKTLHMCPPGKSGDLTILDGVTEVKPWGISQCTKLNKITIPASLTKTESTSFLCSGREYVVKSGNSKFSTIDNGVLCNKAKNTIISFPHHHDGHNSPWDYTIPNGITTISRAAFYVSNVRNLDLNDVETIDEKAFQFSYALETLKIGRNVKTIGKGAFSGCAKLAHIKVHQNNPYYKAEDDVLFNKAGDHLIQCATTKSGKYRVPDGVKSIDFNAFLETKSLSSVTVSKDVETISNGAFSRSGIKKIDFENGSKLKNIEKQAFYQADGLESVTIPASVTTIGPEAFRSIKTLKKVTFASGSNLDKIVANSFSDNPNLETVSFEGTSHITAIEADAFARDKKLKSFIIPASVTTIEQNAFMDTPSMTTVTFAQPATIETISKGAFAYSGIKAINLPESVTKIEQQAFDNCKGLTTVHVPANLNNIETGAFNMCESMKAFTVDARNTKYKALDGMLCDNTKTELVVFPAGKADTRYTLIPNFTTVKPYAFYGSQKVTNITFPKSVTSIGTHAIALCDHLKSLSFMGEDNVPTLTEDIMYKSGNQKNVTIFVRKKWYENTSNTTAVDTYNAKFKEVHPSFVTENGYDRGTEFFPTSIDHVGVISFYTPRTSVIIDKKAVEPDYTDTRGKHWNTKPYGVSSILDYAYENNNKVQDIVVLADIGIVGLKAFQAGNQLKGIYFVGKTPATLNSVNYELPAEYPFKNRQAIYVRPSVVNAYKTAWDNNNKLSITSQIPQTTSSYGATRCYPFDVQFNNSSDVRPYLPVDFSRMSPTYPYARARRIDDGYVPAFLGVLLHSVNSQSATSYCEMTDAQDGHAVNDPSHLYSKTTYKMVGVVEDTEVSSTASNNNYAFSKSQGMFLKLKQAPMHNTMPHFSAYMKLDSNNQAKVFSLRFDDDNSSVTGIDNLQTEEETFSNAPYYNLNGMQVNKPTKGVYIHNGKKVIIK